MKMIEFFQKWRAIKSYVKVLPPILKKKYGKHKRYTERQVRKAVMETGLNQKYMDFALAMYISRQEFENLKKEREVSCDYDEARQEIAEDFFGGSIDFTIHDALDGSSDFFSGDINSDAD